jgi:hypothetical protein
VGPSPQATSGSAISNACIQGAQALEPFVRNICTMLVAYTLLAVPAFLQPLGSWLHRTPASGASGTEATAGAVAACISSHRIAVRHSLLAGGHTMPACASLKTLFELLLNKCDAGSLLGLPDTLQPHQICLAALDPPASPQQRPWPAELLSHLLEGVLRALPLSTRATILSASDLPTSSPGAQHPHLTHTAALSAPHVLATVILQELAGAIAAVVDVKIVQSAVVEVAGAHRQRHGQALWAAVVHVVQGLGGMQLADFVSARPSRSWQDTLYYSVLSQATSCRRCLSVVCATS